MITDLLCFALSGFFMKFSDEAMDEKNNLILAIITGILCVFFTVYVCVNSSDATCIFIAILVGTFLARKVDSLNHILSAIFLIVMLVLIGFPKISLLCLVLCVIASFLDEKGNDLIDLKIEEKKELNKIDYLLEYRYILKITVLILSFLGLVKVFYPNFLGGFTFFNPETIICFYFFDLSYEIAGYLFNRFYNFF